MIYAELLARARRSYIQPSELAIAAAAAGMLDDAIAHAQRPLARVIRRTQILEVLALESTTPRGPTLPRDSLRNQRRLRPLHVQEGSTSLPIPQCLENF